MDDQPNSNPEFAHSTSFNPASPSSGSGMFSDCQSFTVCGQTFTNIANYTTAPSVPSNFRMIPLGDIDLQREIRMDKCAVQVNHSPEQVRVRQIYSAKVEGRKSSVTVAMYQGRGAEKEWREDIAKYMSARHPNIIQITGAASSDGIHATIFHDELIPFKEFLQPYQHSHFLKVLVYACCTRDFSAGRGFLSSAFSLSPWFCTTWVRLSTGRLCVDPTQYDGSYWLDDLDVHDTPDIYALSANTPESIKIIIDSLSTKQYHTICDMYFSTHLAILISASATVKLGAIYFSPSHSFENLVEISSLSCAHLHHWVDSGEVMADGWTRFQSGKVLGRGTITLHWSNNDPAHSWLSQCNYIFRHLHITSKFEDYVYFGGVRFCIEFPETTEDIPAGFLFLCPAKDFETGPLSFRWPDCAAYWSVDPFGVDRLSPEEAAQLGFPALQLTTRVFGSSWDASVYEGLFQFHQAKGFDPYSQDLARHLGHPLYQFFPEVVPLFAHVDEEDFDSGSDWETVYTDKDSTVEDVADTDQLSYFEEDHLSPTTISGDDLSEPAEILVGQDYPSESSFRQYNVEIPSVHEEMPAPSGTFKSLMNIQLVLILFLTSSWLYDHFNKGSTI